MTDQQPSPQPPAAQPQSAAYYEPAPSPHGASVASLVTGIVGIVFCWIPLIGFGCQVAAVITGAIGLQHPNGRGMAVAGLIMGAVMLVLDVLLILFVIVIAVTASQTAH